MVKCSDKIEKAIKRFPTAYKIQVEKMLDEAIKDTTCIVSDTMLQAAMIALIEDFGFGTNKRSNRIQKFVKSVQNIVDTTAMRYDDAMAYGLNNRLHELGIEYKMK